MAFDNDPNMSARELVMVLAHTMDQAGLATRRVGGTIGFFVTGDDGGRWVVDMDSPGGHWLEVSEEATLPDVGTAIVSSGQAFSDLFLLPATIPTLMANGSLEVQGDTDRLRRLAQMLSVGGSLLDLRARGGA